MSKNPRHNIDIRVELEMIKAEQDWTPVNILTVHISILVMFTVLGVLAEKGLSRPKEARTTLS